MWTDLNPIDARLHVRKMGLENAASMIGLAPKELEFFLETQKGDTPVRLGNLFPPKAPGRPMKHDPVRVQHLLDTVGRRDTAKEMGVTVGTLNNYISTNGLVAPKTKKEIPPAEELDGLMQNYTHAEIADVYGVTTVTVGRWAGRYGLTSKKERISAARKKYDFKEMLRTKTLPQIAQETGFSEGDIISMI